MLSIERRNHILSTLRSSGRVLVSELSRQYNVSEETIRRDLEKLEKEGHATKTYGGAVLNEESRLDQPYTVRKKTNVEAKKKMAAVISELVNDGDYIMLDDSSTAVFVARQLKPRKNLTVITNSVEIIMELSEVAGWNVISTGGSLKYGSLALVGRQAEKMIGGYHVDLTVISCKGIDDRYGFTDANESNALIKLAMLNAANRKILAVDSSKFDKLSFVQIDELSILDAVATEKKPDTRWEQIFAENSVECLFPEV